MHRSMELPPLNSKQIDETCRGIVARLREDREAVAVFDRSVGIVDEAITSFRKLRNLDRQDYIIRLSDFRDHIHGRLREVVGR